MCFGASAFDIVIANATKSLQLARGRFAAKGVTCNGCLQQSR